jgi:hypothetical protein
MRFRAFASAYIACEDMVPSYWNASLTNFLMDLRPRPGIIDQHPLRVFRTGAIPGDLPHDEFDAVWWMANSKNRVLTFSFADAQAFIEHLPAYEETKRELEVKEGLFRTTSLMIGSIPTGAGTTPQEVKDWFPVDLLYGLTLASGTGRHGNY